MTIYISYYLYTYTCMSILTITFNSILNIKLFTDNHKGRKSLRTNNDFMQIFLGMSRRKTVSTRLVATAI